MASPSGVTWKPFWISCVTLNKFLFRPGISAVSDNVTGYIFLSRLWQPCQSPCFFPVSVPLSITVNLVFALFRFDILSSALTICDVEPESVVNVLLSYLWLETFSVNILSLIITSVMLISAPLLSFLFL